MTGKKVVVFATRVIALTILGLIVTILASAITPRPEIVKAAQNSPAGQTILLLLFQRFILALIFAFILETTTLRGIRLMALLFWTVFGITTVVMQMETIIFGSAFPGLTTSDVLLLAFTAMVTELIFVPSSVFVMGKWKSNGVAVRPLFNNTYPLKIVIMAVIFPVLYFVFGYFVAWQSAAVREFYATTTITTAQPLLTIIQIIRGALWVFAGLPLFVMFDKRSYTVIASTLCYSLLPSVSLLLPNPLMPEPVRLVHFVEISLSMALFGALTGWIMTGKTKVNLF
jgi:hypothetical protein